MASDDHIPDKNNRRLSQRLAGRKQPGALGRHPYSKCHGDYGRQNGARARNFRRPDVGTIRVRPAPHAARPTFTATNDGHAFPGAVKSSEPVGDATPDSCLLFFTKVVKPMLEVVKISGTIWGKDGHEDRAENPRHRKRDRGIQHEGHVRATQFVPHL